MSTACLEPSATVTAMSELSVPVGYVIMTNVAPQDWCIAVDRQHRTIGRGRKAEGRVPPDLHSVSRQHAKVWADEQRVSWISDNGSRAGTRVNGVSLEAHTPVQLAPGDRLLLGPLELKYVTRLPMLAQLVAETGIKLPTDGESSASLSSIIHTDQTFLPVLSLTPSELEIVLWMCRGVITNEDLGEQLCRSANTIRTQVGMIFKKMEVTSRAELIGQLMPSRSR